MTPPDTKGQPDLTEPPPLDTPAAAADESAAKDKEPERSRRRSHKKPVSDGGTGSGPTKRGPGRPPKPKIGERLGGMIAGVGVGIMAVNPSDGAAVIAGAEELGMALEKWSEESPAVRRVLENLLEASAAGMVAIAVAKIALPIASNHGLLPESMAPAVSAMAGGVAPPFAAPANGSTEN